MAALPLFSLPEMAVRMTAGMGGSIPTGFCGAERQIKGPLAALGSPGGDEPGGLLPFS